MHFQIQSRVIMEKIQTLRGFKDVLDEEMLLMRRIESVARKHLVTLGFKEIETPILEKTDLFVRSIGDATDIVEKEMFTFRDLGGDSVTLRPEATAGVVRAYLQSGMYAKERMSKVFMVGPMFRHEKPQKGRFREFHQIDVEVFGIADPLIDAEFLWLITRILEELSVKNYTIEVNSVGCKACRADFRTLLTSYFGARKDSLCDDCVRRLEKNPLRIFDCKNERCIETGANSPLLFDSLCGDCKEHFDAYLLYLSQFGVEPHVNKRLVRGLDYYTKAVFEVTSDDLGAQKAFIAGGRYDDLVEEMGGPKTPGTGFAIGVERLSLITPPEDVLKRPSFFLAYLGRKARAHLVPLLIGFAGRGIRLSYSYEEKSLKAQMRYADSLGTGFTLILGDDEIDRGVIVVRNMADKTQYELPFDTERFFQEIDALTA